MLWITNVIVIMSKTLEDEPKQLYLLFFFTNIMCINKSQTSTYIQKTKVALKELSNIARDRKKWSSLSKAVCEIKRVEE